MLSLVRKLVLAIAGLVALAGLLLYVNSKVDIPEGVRVAEVRAIEEPAFAAQLLDIADFARMRAAGFNTVVVSVPNPVISGKPRLVPLASSAVALIVKKAHLAGLAVMLVPEVTYERPDAALFASAPFRDDLVNVSRGWAEFAESYHVEYFVPLRDPAGLLGVEKGHLFLAEVLPEVRERYRGKVVADLGQALLLESTAGATPMFSASMSTNDRPSNLYLAEPDARAYDYALVTFVPPVEVRNFELYAVDARRALATLKRVALRKGAGRVIARGLNAPVAPTGLFGDDYGPVVVEKQQAELVGALLETAKDANVGIVLTGWRDPAVGVRGRPAEDAARAALGGAPSK